ncbi:MAG: protein TolR [Gammaproteobacteria bacterium]|nr:protein TolR [Gammaproteobacteria bacterium]MYD79273.1 protein TolR [Gammaproteobacteria bacterium]
MAVRRRPMSQINVVPLIDVMLVLLVISMVAVPMLTQGIDVDLPQNSSELLEGGDDNPLVVTLSESGRIYVNIGVTDIYDEDEFVSLEELKDRTAKVLNARPRVPVFVRADERLAYGQVVEVMQALQDSGASNVGLITEPPEV